MAMYFVRVLKLLPCALILTCSNGAAAEQTRDEINVPPAYEQFYSKWHFAPTARSGDLIFVAGVIGFEKDLTNVIADPERQIRAAFEILRDCLAAQGASLADVIDLTTFHAPGTDRKLFSRIKNEYMAGPAYPAWTAVTVNELSFGAIVEIKAVAVRKWNPVITGAVEGHH